MRRAKLALLALLLTLGLTACSSLAVVTADITRLADDLAAISSGLDVIDASKLSPDQARILEEARRGLRAGVLGSDYLRRVLNTLGK